MEKCRKVLAEIPVKDVFHGKKATLGDKVRDVFNDNLIFDPAQIDGQEVKIRNMGTNTFRSLEKIGKTCRNTPGGSSMVEKDREDGDRSLVLI